MKLKLYRVPGILIHSDTASYVWCLLHAVIMQIVRKINLSYNKALRCYPREFTLLINFTFKTNFLTCHRQREFVSFIIGATTSFDQKTFYFVLWTCTLQYKRQCIQILLPVLVAVIYNRLLNSSWWVCDRTCFNCF